MSVIDVRFVNESSERGENATTGLRSYLVIVNDLADDSETARTDPGIPNLGDTWNPGSTMTARKIAAKRSRNDGQTTFEVTVNYSDADDSGSSSGTSPLAEPAEIEWAGLSERESYFEDVDAKAAVNTANHPFDQLPERDVAKGVTLRVSRNVSGNLTSSLKNLHKSINSGSVTIDGLTFPAGTARIEDYSVSGPLTQNGVTYRRTSVTITGRPNWDDIFESRGRRDVDGKDILDLHGERVADPWPLDAAGAALASPADTPALVTLKPYVETGFSSISSIWS